eukprot:12770917-Ditylum_brightwellii.AAC.1
MGRKKRELGEMKERQDAAGPVRCHKLERTKNTGAWLTVVPDRLNGTEFCGHKLTVEHALLCAHGGLVLIRHNNACSKFGSLSKTGLIPSAVSYKPLIHSGRTAQVSAGLEESNEDASEEEEVELENEE